MKNRETRHRRDAGFAMLFVFLLSAAIAITLYMELPRVAFEARRMREDMLIERGKEYQRGIQLFYRKFRNYPPNLEALENTNNIRFLRRRYTDPMTGKDEWRLIHAGPGGVLLDSLVTKPPGKDSQEAKSVNTFTAELPSIGSAQNPAGPSGALPPRRASEGASGPVATGMGGTPIIAGTGDLTTLTGSGVQAGAAQPGGFSPQGGTPPPGIYPQLVPGQPPSAPVQQPFQQAIPVPGLPAPYPQPVGQQPATGSPGTAVTVGAPLPFQIPASPPGAARQGGGSESPVVQNPAAKMIMEMLTRPNPQGIAAVQQPATGITASGGLAGVASKFEADSIKVYNDRTKYQEWEFVYDPRVDRMVAGALRGPGAPGAPTVPGGPAAPGAPQQPGMSPFPQGPAPGFPPIIPPQQPVPGSPGPRRVQ